MNKKNLKLGITLISYAGIIGIILYLVINHFRQVESAGLSLVKATFPILKAALFAFFIYPFYNFIFNALYKRMDKILIIKIISTIISLIIFVIVFFSIKYSLGDMLINEANDYRDRYLTNVNQLEYLLNGIFISYFNSIPSIVAYFYESMSPFLYKIIENINFISYKTNEYISDNYINIIFYIFIGIILVNYRRRFFYQMDRLNNAMFTIKTGERTKSLFSKLIETIDINVVGIFYKSFFMAILLYGFMILLGLDYALFCSVFIFIFSLVPKIGANIGIILLSLLYIIINPLYALIIFSFLLVDKSIYRLLIFPESSDEKKSFMTVWIILFIIVFYNLFDAIGIFIASPIYIFIHRLLRGFIKRREDNNALNRYHREVKKNETKTFMEYDNRYSKARAYKEGDEESNTCCAEAVPENIKNDNNHLNKDLEYNSVDSIVKSDKITHNIDNDKNSNTLDDSKVEYPTYSDEFIESVKQDVYNSNEMGINNAVVYIDNDDVDDIDNNDDLLTTSQRELEDLIREKEEKELSRKKAREEFKKSGFFKSKLKK